MVSFPSNSQCVCFQYSPFVVLIYILILAELNTLNGLLEERDVQKASRWTAFDSFWPLSVPCYYHISVRKASCWTSFDTFWPLSVPSYHHISMRKTSCWTAFDSFWRLSVPSYHHISMRKASRWTAFDSFWRLSDPCYHHISMQTCDAVAVSPNANVFLLKYELETWNCLIYSFQPSKATLVQWHGLDILSL
jgi:hypothetical protein